MAKSTKSTKPTKNDLYQVLRQIIEEMDMWDVPQFDDTNAYGPNSSVGKARKMLNECGVMPTFSKPYEHDANMYTGPDGIIL